MKTSSDVKNIKTDFSLAKHYSSKAMLLGIGVGAISIILGFKPFGKAFVLGALCSSINFTLMSLFLNNLLFSTRKAASFKAFLFVLIRFGILGIPLILSLTTKSFDFIGAAIGIFAVQMVIGYEKVMLSLVNRKKSIRI